jgi:hypothetical protein
MELLTRSPKQKDKQKMILFFCTVALASIHQSIRIANVDVLTFSAGRATAARRQPAVAQLDCRGAYCSSEFMPVTVQCRNQGSDGRSTQWHCQAELNERVKFGRIEVTCEGYSFTGDEFVLVGSCGLEYELVARDVNHGVGNQPRLYGRRVGEVQRSDDIVVPILAAVCIVVVFGLVVLLFVWGCTCASPVIAPTYVSGYGYGGNWFWGPSYRSSAPSYSSYPSSSSSRSSGGSRSASGFGGTRSR